LGCAFHPGAIGVRVFGTEAFALPGIMLAILFTTARVLGGVLDVDFDAVEQLRIDLQTSIATDEAFAFLNELQRILQLAAALPEAVLAKSSRQILSGLAEEVTGVQQQLFDAWQNLIEKLI